MGASPTVSVLIVTRDRPRLLADALASVGAQRIAPLEVRIADDGTQAVHEVVETSGLLEVTVLRAGFGQAAAARNLAAQGARGEVLAFLDDDDRWHPDHLEGLVDACADPAVGLAYRDCVVVRERVEPDGRRVDLEGRPIARDWDPERMRHDDYIPPSAWGVRRELFQRLGGFDESFRFSEDWDFLMRAAAFTRPRRVPGVSVEIRMREQGHASTDSGPERRACLDRLSARHGLPRLEIKTFWDVALVTAAPPSG